jgi:hypothetical protein
LKSWLCRLLGHDYRVENVTSSGVCTLRCLRCNNERRIYVEGEL